MSGDHLSLREALVTILDNAVKYSLDKSEVNVTAAKKQGNVEIKIADHGIGIKAADQPYIFDRFYRADTARSKHHADGYGLGLAIAKNIVEMHGGRITVSSRPGKGSVFTVALPAA